MAGPFRVNEYGDLVDERLPKDFRPAGALEIAAKAAERKTEEDAAKAADAEAAYKAAVSPAHRAPDAPDISKADSPTELLARWRASQAPTGTPDDLRNAIASKPGATTPEDFTQSALTRAWGNAAVQQPVVLPPEARVAHAKASSPSAPFKPDMYPTAAGPENAPPSMSVEEAVGKAPPRPPSAEDEIAAAQEESRGRVPLSILADFLSGFSSKGEELRKKIDATVKGPVTDLLERKKFLDDRTTAARATEEYERKKATFDENSPQSQMATKLAISKGLLKPGEKISLDMYPLIEKGATLEEARREHDIQSKHADAQINATLHEGAANRANQLLMERERTAAELAKERIAKGSGAGTKELPPEAAKINNQLTALKDTVDLAKQHSKTGPVETLVPFGQTPSNIYNEQLKAKAENIAAGKLPLGRETPAAVEHEIESLPTARAGRGLAGQNFKSTWDAIHRNAKAQIDTLAASGKYDPAQIADLRQKLAASEAEAAAAGLAPGGTAAPQMIKLGGKTFRRGPNDEAIEVP